MARIPVLTIQPLPGRAGPSIQHINNLRQMQALSDRYEFHGLIADGHEMHGPLAEVAAVHTLPHLPTMPRTMSPWRLAKYYRDARRIARDIADLGRRIDARVMYTFNDAFPAGSMAGRALGIPTMVQILGMTIFKPRYVAVGWSKVLRRLADRIIACQDIIADHLHALGIPRENLRVVYNGVDTEAIRAEAETAPAPELPSHTTKVGMVASMDPRKGHVTLIRAAANVCRRIDDAHFYSIGSTAGHDAHYAEMKGEVKRLAIEDRFTFTGAVESASAWMRAMDIYTNVSFTEALSVAVIEAMALSRPIVATDIEGNPIVVAHGETGLLSRPADPQDLAEKIIELLNDTQRRAAMGQAGRERAERMFTLEKNSRKLLEVLDELVGA